MFKPNKHISGDSYLHDNQIKLNSNMGTFIHCIPISFYKID